MKTHLKKEFYNQNQKLLFLLFFLSEKIMKPGFDRSRMWIEDNWK
jgi:hypothetical protein